MLMYENTTCGHPGERQKNTGGRRQTRFALCLFVMLFFILAAAVSALAEDIHIQENANWSGSFKNLDWDHEVDPFFKLDFSSGKTVLLFIPVPDLRMGVNFRIGVRGDFELNLKQANLGGISLDSKLDGDTAGLYRYRISEDLLKDVPLPIGFNVTTDFLAGCTQPVELKGTFENTTRMSIGIPDVNFRHDASTRFTSVKPKTPNRETVFFVGTNFNDGLGLGQVSFMGYTIGPILSGTINYFGGAIGKAVLKKDERVFTDHLPDDVNEIHSCTETGKRGCVQGQARNVKDIYLNAEAGLTLPIIDYEIFHKVWRIANNYIRSGVEQFVQSLTWREPLEYRQACDHYYYKVPVAVWADQQMTRPVNGVLVSVKDGVAVDNNVARYTLDVPGDGTGLPDGRVNLYLPFKNGRYTIRAETDDHLEGEKEQPSNMIRGLNEQVDIILESGERVAYTAVKEWDIDLEDKDRPDSVEVLLQSLHYNQGYWQWQGVEKKTLNEGNHWTCTFAEVPKYELDDRGRRQEIKYRIRELKADSDEIQIPDDLGPLLEEDEVGFLPEADGMMRPAAIGDDELSKACGRVVLSRWDFDNINVWKQLKNRVTDWNQLWQLSPTESYVKNLAKESVFPKPFVTYEVDAYTTIVGERVEKHQTKYYVEYEEEGTTTTITNTAVLDINTYKRWIMLGDAKEPESVYLALLYRPKEEYREYIGGGAAEKFIGLWLPVIKPIKGDMINIFSLIGLDTLAKLDVLNKISIPLSIGKAKAPKDNENPLVAWRVKFTVKKYGWLGIPGIPVEFQGEELSSAIVTDVLKFLTGLDIPVSFSFNPFSGDKYVTVPGPALKLPVLDKDWEMTSNVINTWAESDGDDTTAIGGIKHWVNDKAEDRPDTLTIVIRDGETEIGRATINKSDNNIEDGDGNTKNNDSWAWSLKSTEVTAEGVTLDPEKTYTISEEYPEHYDKKDKYVCEVKGHDIFNTWAGDTAPKIRVKKIYEHRPTAVSDSVTICLYDDTGSMINEHSIMRGPGYGFGQEVKYYVEEDETVRIRGKDISKFRVEETDYNTGTWMPFYSGPEMTIEDGTPVYTFTVRNRSKRDIVKIEVEKKWSGDEGHEDSRPARIPVKVMRNGEECAACVLNSQEDWRASVQNDAQGNRLLKFDPQTGKEYVYTLQEDETEGYRCSVSERTGEEREISETEGGFYVVYYETAHTFTLTNEWTGSSKFVTVKGTKTWEDDNNSAGTRPQSIRINIFNDRQGLVKTLDVTGPAGSASSVLLDGEEEETGSGTGADAWFWSVSGLPRYGEDGTELQYYVIEGTVPAEGGTDPDAASPGIEGYKAVYADPVFDEGTLTWTCDITNNNKIRSVIVRKQWEDDDDAPGLRPDSVTVRLYRSTAEGKEEISTASLSGENGWIHVFDDLPARDENGTEISYDIEEEPVEAYITGITGSMKDGYTISNRIEEGWTNIPVTKVWEGDAAVKDVRPSRVTVRLIEETGEDGREAGSIELTASGGWKGVFRGIRLTDENGEAIRYHVEEDPVSGYRSPVITGSAEQGFTITNTFNNKVNVTVKKAWEEFGQENPDRPGRIGFVLYRKLPGEEPEPVIPGTVLSLEASNGWTRTFEDQDKYNDGVEYQYYVREGNPPAGYNVSYSESAEGGGITLTILNTLQSRTISVRKVWDDDENAQNLRPEYVTVHLLADGQRRDDDPAYVRNIPGNGVNYFNVPVFADGEEDEKRVIQYSVEEDPVPGYIATITGNMGDGFTVTNTLSPDKREKKDITVTKNWDDESNINNNRPSSVRIYLLADGRKVRSQDIQAMEGDTWTCTFEDVNVFRTGSDGEPRLINYSVREEPVPGYISHVNGFTITNTVETISFPVTKTWVNDDESSRPEKIYVDLYKNGVRVDKETKGVTAADHWSCTFTDLPMYENGEEINYSVGEYLYPANANYRAGITGSVDEGFVITNTWDPVITTGDITVEKVWLDGEESHPPVKVILKSDIAAEGELQYAAEQTIEGPGSDGKWRCVFENQPLRTRGPVKRVIRYDVEEEIPEGYGEPYISTNNGYDFVITNWKESGVTVRVDKEWADDNNSLQTRPGSITVRLFSDDGTETKEVDEKTIGAEDEWKCSFTDLPVEKDGVRITYWITEDEVEGYETSITALDPGGSSPEGLLYIWKITNTLRGKTEKPVVTKKVRETHDGNGRVSEWQDAADYDIGDMIPYRITGTLPYDFALYRHYTVYTFTDVLSGGLTPPEASQISVTKNGTTDIKEKFDVAVSGQTITVSLREGEDMRAWTEDCALSAGDTIVISYEAALNRDAVTGSPGNPNTVTLTYTTDPGTGGTGAAPAPPETTPPDLVTVFTYSIQVNKTDETGEPLAGAGFTLYKKTAYEWTQAGEEITGVTEFVFRGVDSGDYRIVETTVPPGCTKAEDVQITVRGTYDTEADDPRLKTLLVTPDFAGFVVHDSGQTEGSSGTAEGGGSYIETDGVAEGTILNRSGSRLPSTGGSGTGGIYALGALLMALGAAAMIRRRRP